MRSRLRRFGHHQEQKQCRYGKRPLHFAHAPKGILLASAVPPKCNRPPEREQPWDLEIKSYKETRKAGKNTQRGASERISGFDLNFLASWLPYFSDSRSFSMPTGLFFGAWLSLLFGPGLNSA